MYKIVYDGKTNIVMHVLIKERPSIPSPEYDYETVKIPGRDGDLYIEQKSVKDITVPISFTFACRPEQWQRVARGARKWLMKAKDKHLILSDSPDHYYKVKHVTVNETERQAIEVGEFSADFICEGRQYLISGDMPLDLTYREAGDFKTASIWNQYEESMPVFIISGSGAFEMMVNGSKLEADVNGQITVDTQREVAYKQDMSSANTDITCNYKELALVEGENIITVASGFDVQILPKWREI